MTDTLSFAVTFQHEVKKSTFIASAIPLFTSTNPQTELGLIFNNDATHNCWAYRFGDQTACHDANEPTGTAGRPILAVIDAMNYDRIGVVVARSFGGIKLGSAGLIRAYRQTTVKCLQSRTRQPIIKKSKIRLYCRFDQIGAVYAVLHRFAVQVEQQNFDAYGVSVLAEVISDQLDIFKKSIIDATANHVALTEEQHHAGF